MKYTMVATDSTYMVSTYFATKGSRDSFALVVKSDSQFAQAMRADFDQLFASATKLPLA